MPPQNPESQFAPNTATVTEQKCPWYQPLCKVTPLSKYLALVIFIVLPFVGAYVGYTLAPEKFVETPVVKATHVTTTNTNNKNSVEVSQPVAERTTTAAASEFQGMITLSFNKDPVDMSELIIRASNSGQISKPINLTGWTLESKQIGVLYTFDALRRTNTKYTTATSTNLVDIAFYPNGGEYMTVKIDAAVHGNFVYSAEGGDSYRYFSVTPLWGSAHDTITLRDSKGMIVSVFQY